MFIPARGLRIGDDTCTSNGGLRYINGDVRITGDDLTTVTDLAVGVGGRTAARFERDTTRDLAGDNVHVW